MNRFKIYVIVALITLLMTFSVYAEDNDYDDFATKSLLIKGKVLNRHGQLVQGPVKLNAYIGQYKGEDPNSRDPDVIMDITEEEKTINDGTFIWQFGKATVINVIPMKDGYNGFLYGYIYDFGEQEVVIDDALLYLIKKENPTDLEWTDYAYILPIDDKIAGWSFKRRWYYPADNYDVLMKCYTEDKKNAVLEMKDGGGFIEFKGYPYFEGNLEDMMKSFELMTEAPEMGYKQNITITPELRDIARNQGLYYYFRTPDGKYGKMKIHGFGKGMCNFSYYLNPTGGRSLELKEEINRSPKNPKELYPFPEE